MFVLLLLLEEGDPVVTVATSSGGSRFRRLSGGGEMRLCWEAVIVHRLASAAASREVIDFACIKNVGLVMVANVHWQCELEWSKSELQLILEQGVIARVWLCQTAYFREASITGLRHAHRRQRHFDTSVKRQES